MRDRDRESMVREQIEARGIHSPAVLEAIVKVPRHLFVPKQAETSAYEDRPLAIGYGQTISQPYIVALMAECLHCVPGQKVLEIGTGSGYMAAVLRYLGLEVYSIERIAPLFRQARSNLDQLGLEEVHLSLSDGYRGWAEFAPYDGIIISCASPVFPEEIWAQVKDGGRMLMPFEENGIQRLMIYQKNNNRIVSESVCFVRFVPMVPGVEKNL